MGGVGLNSAQLSFNLNHKDPAVREIFMDKRFRIAASHALNRERIKAGLPAITPSQATAAATGQAAKTSTVVGLVAVASLGGALLWSMRRRRRR